MKPLIVGLTGASGAIYATRMLRHLMEIGQDVALVVSEPAKIVIREELNPPAASFSKPEDWVPLLGEKCREHLKIYSSKDFSAPIASGSYPAKGMVVIPCSMGTLGSIANGISQNLIHRAADCVIKERRKLVLVPRETPLSAIHLENMLKLSRIGCSIVPAMPGFYSGVKSLEEVVDFMVGKVFDQLDIEHMLYPRWVGLTGKNQSAENAYKL